MPHISIFVLFQDPVMVGPTIGLGWLPWSLLGHNLAAGNCKHKTLNLLKGYDPAPWVASSGCQVQKLQLPIGLMPTAACSITLAPHP
jgi:hypothetical protein